MKQFGSILISIALVISLASCSGGGTGTPSASGSQSSPDSGQTDSSSTGGGDAVRLKVAMFNDGTSLTEAQKSVFESFTQENPDIVPEFQFITSDSYGQNWNGYLMKIQTMIASGNAPDVAALGLEGVAMLVMNDLALPMNDYIDAHPEAASVMDSIDEELLQIFVVDGQLYGVPYEANSVVTHIRKDIFEEAGIDLPAADWTLDDFKQICAQIKAADTGAFAFGVPTNFFCLQALLYANGAAPLNDEWDAAAINSPESVEIFQFLQDAIYEYGYAPQPSDTITDVELIVQGRTAMGWWGRWVSNDYNASELYNTIYAQNVPAGKAGNVTCAGTASYVVLGSTQHPDEAMQVALWCAGDSYADTYLSVGSLPASRAIGDRIIPNDPTIENWEVMFGVYENGTWRRSQDPPEYADLASVYSKYVDIIYSNQMPAQEALDLAAQEINQVFAESTYRQTPEDLAVVASLFKN